MTFCDSVLRDSDLGGRVKEQSPFPGHYLDPKYIRIGEVSLHDALDQPIQWELRSIGLPGGRKRSAPFGKRERQKRRRTAASGLNHKNIIATEISYQHESLLLDILKSPILNPAAHLYAARYSNRFSSAAGLTVIISFSHLQGEQFDLYHGLFAGETISSLQALNTLRLEFHFLCGIADKAFMDANFGGHWKDLDSAIADVQETGDKWSGYRTQASTFLKPENVSDCQALSMTSVVRSVMALPGLDPRCVSYSRNSTLTNGTVWRILRPRWTAWRPAEVGRLCVRNDANRAGSARVPVGRDRAI
ncbi:hypothetical protein DFP72DRAFT_847970 [Ephemerocybe angulata]|uniref:Uncharacterized protein n=1 Tax=Ephemerocybe angulata TaxID=980116 RepID=A0A8H6M8F3_9AGAR|nr:hypothetical protein DFP72DRAFT_847970 [Tulosesus angulatus]